MSLPLHTQPALDVEALRGDFPILSRTIHDRPLVYLDSASSSQKPKAVIDAVSRYYQESHANIHRGVYVLSEEATVAYEQAHVRVAEFIHADFDEMIFTKNTTEALNLVAYAWGLSNLKAGDEVVLTPLEHHSNLVPWQQVARRTGAAIRYIRLTADGCLDMAHAAETIGPRTKLVSVAQVSNVLGTVNPVDELGRMAHAHGALLCVDGAQSIPHMAIDVRAMDCDFFAFSGHKMLGPTGIGGLYGRRRILEDMEPFLFGGDMISEVTLESASWNELPWKFEAGHAAHRTGHRVGGGGRVFARHRHGGGAGARAHPVPLRPGAIAADARPRRLRPRVRRRPQRRDFLQPRPPAPARRGLDSGPARRRHSRRPPLRHAAHAQPRAQQHLPGELLRLQHHRGDQRPRRSHRRGQEVVTAMSFNMYQENILDHYENPYNRGSLPQPTLEFRGLNPLCGDEVCIQACLDPQGRLEKVCFEGEGCVISLAAASMLMEAVEGKTLEEVKGMDRQDMLDLVGITLTTMRVKCAMLPLRTLGKAIHQYEAEADGS